MVKQKLVEEVHLYCSPLELEEFIQHFCSSFIQKFHEIADLSTFSVEKESDDYNLSSEDVGKSNFEDRQNYVLKQKFTCMVHEKDGEPCEEDLDLISDRIFEVVKRSVGSTASLVLKIILMTAINRHSRIPYQSSIGMVRINVARHIQTWHHQDFPHI